ncbi:MAG: archaeosortase/exosortase family protein [Bacteroidetes bacterium]|nr:archaeosortase/exosortase family protein [Bacteroidota bacterium]
MGNVFISIKNFIRKHHLEVLKDVALFILITAGIHFAWRFWQTQFNYAPIRDFMYGLMGQMAAEVYRESVWVIDRLLDITRVDETMYMYFPNRAIMYVNDGCSGLKQILQFGLLMLIFPGPWKKKLWFIPLGMLIMHLTNIFRMIGLAVIMNNWPWYWHFSHDYIFRPLFYLVIFLLWMFWVERIRGSGDEVRGTGEDILDPR